MYCIKCGVKLADSEKVCPLCNTEVYHPDLYIKHAPSPYPKFNEKQDQISKSGMILILTLLFLIPVIVLLLVDHRINSRFTWSGIAMLGIALGYCLIVLPLWFRKPNPVVFVPIDFVLAGGYLLYINAHFGGEWFLPFAFPVCVTFGVITTAATVLFKYLRRGRLFVFGGLMFALGGACLLVEFFINLTFGTRSFLIWSPYPCAALGIIGIAFLVIAICTPIRNSLEKRFFI